MGHLERNIGILRPWLCMWDRRGHLSPRLRPRTPQQIWLMTVSPVSMMITARLDGRAQREVPPWRLCCSSSCSRECRLREKADCSSIGALAADECVFVLAPVQQGRGNTALTGAVADTKRPKMGSLSAIYSSLRGAFHQH